jgi:hypothetical protein
MAGHTPLFIGQKTKSMRMILNVIVLRSRPETAELAYGGGKSTPKYLEEISPFQRLSRPAPGRCKPYGLPCHDFSFWY